MTDSPNSLYKCCLLNIVEHLNFILNWNNDSLTEDEFDDEQLLSRLKLFLKFNNQYHHHGRSLYIPSTSSSSSSSTSSSSTSGGGPPTEDLTNYNTIGRQCDDKLKALKQSCQKFVNTFFLGKRAIAAAAATTTTNNGQNNDSNNNNNENRLNNILESDRNTFGVNQNNDEDEDGDGGKVAGYFRICNTVCEDIFNCFQQKYPVTDSFFNLSIFQGGFNQIHRVDIKDASKLTSAGLKVLQSHNVSNLSIAHLTNCTVNQVIACLSPWSRKNLQTFSVSHCQFSPSSRACLVISLSELKSLRSIDVSYTDFNNHGLEIIVEDLPNLESLNISSTKVTMISPLLSHKHRFVRLCLNNLNWACHDEEILTQMTNLTHLEISEDKLFVHRTVSDPLHSFLKQFVNCPRLVELDISGREGIDMPMLRQLVTQKREQAGVNAGCLPLSFLGLVQTTFNHDDIEVLEQLSGNELTIAGEGNLDNIFESLKRYKDRPNFIQRILYYLYSYTLDSEDQENHQAKSQLKKHRSELVLIVVELFQTFFPSLNVVLVSTACLYNLTKNLYSEDLHPHVLKKVADIALEAIDIHHDNQQLMKNILLILCSDRILQEASFDRIKCVRLVMDSLLKFREIHLNRLALAICSVLFAKISTDEASLAGHISSYMERLLSFVEQYKCDHSETGEMMLKLTLSVLWNFTDESPRTCKVFIELNGLKIYLNALRLFEGISSVETKILGLLNNIAEVRELRHHLLDSELLFNLKKLIYSTQIDISYFSAGIIAQLCSEQINAGQWVSEVDKLDLLDNMTQVMLAWKTPNFEMVAYRSFGPFKKLLICNNYMAVQLWALWAIHHVCTMNPPKYCQLLYDDSCLGFIVSINDQQLKKCNIVNQSDKIYLRERLLELASFEQYNNNSSTTVATTNNNNDNNNHSSDSGISNESTTSECANNSSSSSSSCTSGGGGGCLMENCSISLVSNLDNLMSEDEDESLEQKNGVLNCQVPIGTFETDDDDVDEEGEQQQQLSLQTHQPMECSPRSTIKEISDNNNRSLTTIRPHLTTTSCNCRLRYQLTNDPLLCLSTLILKTFQNNCPVLLKNFYDGCCNS